MKANSIKVLFMNPSQNFELYVCHLALLIFMVFIKCVVNLILSKILVPLLFRIRTHLDHPLVNSRVRGSTNVTRLELLIILVYLIISVYFTVGTGIANIESRSAILFSINAVPLFIAGRTSLLGEKILRFRRDQYEVLHRWVGRICAAQAITHSAFSMKKGLNPLSSTNIVLLTSAASLLIFSFVLFRRRFYEIFLKLHFLLALTLLTTLWMHIKIGKNIPTYALTISTSLYASQMLVWMLIFIRRNCCFGRPTPVIQCKILNNNPMTQAVLLSFKPKRPWIVKPGQYVYLIVPAQFFHHFSLLQAHPFYVYSENKQDEQITLLIKTYNGITRELQTRFNGRSLLVDGPYGRSPALHDFDVVYFIALGIGITAYMIWIKHLIEARHQRKARAKRVSLAWVLEAPEQINWALDQLQELTKMENASILTITIYDPSRPKTEQVQQISSRIFTTGERLDTAWSFKKERESEPGDMAISVCGTGVFEANVRSALSKSRIKASFFQAEYQPDDLPGNMSNASNV